MVGLSSLKYRASSTVKKWLGYALCAPAWGLPAATLDCSNILG